MAKKTDAKKTKIEKAKELESAKLEKIQALVNGACFGKIDLTNSKCTSCPCLVACNAKTTANAVNTAVTAEKSKSKGKGKKTSVKNSRKVGIIELFAILLMAEKSLTLPDFITKAYQAGSGVYDNMPLIECSQILTQFEHLAKGKNKPIIKAGYKVARTADSLQVVYVAANVHAYNTLIQ